MKKAVFLIFTGLLWLGCSNNDDSSFNTISGNWNWLESTGGFAGTTETPASTGNTILLEIRSNTIKKYTNGSLTSESTYTIESMESMIYGGQRKMIVYNNDFRQTFKREGNKLYLTDECNDCYLSIYEK